MQTLCDKITFGLVMEFYVNGSINRDKFRQRFVNDKMWQTEDFNVKMTVVQEEE